MMVRVRALLLALVLLPACATAPPPPPPPRHPVLLIGVDGFEWSVVLPMVHDGKLPALTALMKRGVFGRLETLEPTLSPIIWTSIATGKTRKKHGIRDFVYTEGTDVHLYTSGHRRTKAFWNILSDYDLTVHTIGWWVTYPAETINGTMVAQTNTSSQADVSGGKAVWKGTILKGVAGQVSPESQQDAIMEVADQVDRDLPSLARDIFGEFRHPLNELGKRLWENSQWSLRADAIYLRVAHQVLARHEPLDLLAVYLGGTDVVGHRFWRYMRPALYQHRPSDEELANFGHVIESYYAFVDRAVGQLVAEAPADATVMVIADHGMHAVNLAQRFDPNDPPSNINSGHHGDAPPGVFIAAGRDIRVDASVDPARDGLKSQELPVVGRVLDITPTLLALKGIPVGADMDGTVLEKVVTPEFLHAHPPATRRTHDTAEWLAARQAHRHDAPAEVRVEDERVKQLRALGYVQ
jgi:hypothetical protein